MRLECNKSKVCQATKVQQNVNQRFHKLYLGLNGNLNYSIAPEIIRFHIKVTNYMKI